MNKIIQQLAEQAQQTTPPEEQLAVIILLLEDAVRRLRLLKCNTN